MRNEFRPRPQVYQAIENKKNDSNPKLFPLGQARTTFMVKKLEKTTNLTWFRDSCASRYLYNNWRLFINTHAKSIDFMITEGQIIKSGEIGTVLILLNRGITIEWKNIVLAPKCDSNLISLRQLWESGITYYNSPITMILMKKGKRIAQVKRD